MLHIINGVNIYFVTLNKINPTLIRHWSVIVKKDGIFKLENWYLLCAQKICNYTQRAETCALEMKRLSWHWNIAVKQKNGIFKSKNQYCYKFQELLVETTHLNMHHIYNIKKAMWHVINCVIICWHCWCKHNIKCGLSCLPKFSYEFIALIYTLFCEVLYIMKL